METTQTKSFVTKAQADMIAQQQSLDSKDTVFVINSQGLYYIDTVGFVRIWESIVSTWEKGKKVKP